MAERGSEPGSPHVESNELSRVGCLGTATLLKLFRLGQCHISYFEVILTETEDDSGVKCFGDRCLFCQTTAA